MAKKEALFCDCCKKHIIYPEPRYQWQIAASWGRDMSENWQWGLESGAKDLCAECWEPVRAHLQKLLELTKSCDVPF